MYGNQKKMLFCYLLAFIFLTCLMQRPVSAQEFGKLSGYVTIDQNQVTYRTAQACQATIIANGSSRTVCEVDPKLGGTGGFGYNCGARTFTEIFGYWANKGYSGLMPTGVLPGGAIPDYSEQTLALFNLAGVEYTTYGDYDNYFGCHNCAVEFKAYADQYKLISTDLLTKIAAYFTVNAYSATIIAKDPLPSYEEIKAEIVAGRPVALSLGECNHWLTVIGYNDIGPNLIALVGHENFVSEFGCYFLNTGPGIYEAEFAYNSLPISSAIAVFITPTPLPQPPSPPSLPAPVAPPAPPSLPAPATPPDQSIVTYSADGTINRDWLSWQP
ncbi:MAG: hypothetical protein ABFD12_08645 [Syntrophorhabdus sp.]